MNRFKNKIKALAQKIRHYFGFPIPRFTLAIGLFLVMTMASIAFIFPKQADITSAATPAFSLTTSGNLIVNTPTTLTVKLNGSGETFYGAESHITYDTSKILITSVNFGSCVFDSCVDLSESGTLKLLGASGLGGKTVTNQQNFATINVTPLLSGGLTLTFTKSDVINGGQEIKNGGATNANLTIQTAEGAVCGNSLVEAGEACDDGNAINTDACLTTCVAATCGDGFVRTGVEQCDDSNTLNGDGCSATCQLEEEVVTPQCGNGIVEAGETCDDNNTLSGDGCNAVCAIETPEEPEEEPLPEPEAKTLTSLTSSAGVVYKGGGNTGGGLQVGDTVQLVTFAQYSDGSTDNVTSPPKASYTVLSGSGSMIGSQFAPSAPGSATIRASRTEGAITVTDDVTVTASAATPPEEIIPEEEVVEEEVTEETEEETGTVEEPTETPEELLPAAPEVSPDVLEALAEAEALVTETEPTAETLKIPELTDENRDRCAGLSSDMDTDGDGLSDRTECYLGTNPNSKYSESDDCSDGFEIVQRGTDPLTLDCQIFSDVLIMDPQAGWILPTLTPGITGITALETNRLLIAALPAEYKPLKALLASMEALNNLTEDITEEARDEAYTNAKENLQGLQNFLDTYAEEFDYAALQLAAENAEKWLNGETESFDLNNLKALLKGALLAGETETFEDTFVDDAPAKFFSLTSAELEDRKLYDLVAKAYLSDGRELNSQPIRISIDSNRRIQTPTPRSIGGVPLSEGLSFRSFWINRTYAAGLAAGAEVRIEDQRPVVRGESEFGTQVFAIWQSIVLASSVIADSEEGFFGIQAPRDLETDLGHKVNLYAVKPVGDMKIRSETAQVFFRIEVTTFPWKLIGILGLILLLLIILMIVLRRALRRKKKGLAGDLIPEAHKSAEESAHIFEDADKEALGHELKSAEESAKTFEKKLK